MRAFISIDMPEDAKQELALLQEKVRNCGFIEAKDTSPENLHLTLKFLGEIDNERLEQVKFLLSRIKFPPFIAKLSNLGLFSDRILWIKLESPELLKLQQDIDNILSALFKKEARFMAHITIARIKKIKNKQAFLKFIKSLMKRQNVHIKKFYLKESILSPKGPDYRIIQELNLV